MADCNDEYSTLGSCSNEQPPYNISNPVNDCTEYTTIGSTPGPTISGEIPDDLLLPDGRISTQYTVLGQTITEVVDPPPVCENIIINQDDTCIPENTNIPQCSDEYATSSTCTKDNFIVCSPTANTCLEYSTVGTCGLPSVNGIPYDVLLPDGRIPTKYSVDGELSLCIANGEAVTCPSTTFIHNSLPGLQGGTTNQYYHLTLSQYNDYAGISYVVDVSGSLQNAIDANTTLINNLQSSITIIENKIVNIETDVDSISASIDDLTTITLESSGGTVLITQNGNIYNLEVDTSGITAEGISVHNDLIGLQGGILNQYYHLSENQYVDYIGRIEVENISGYLNSEITNINNQLIIINSEITNISGQYTLISTTENISSNLQSQIDNIPIISVSSSGGTILISQNGNNYNLEVDVSGISAENGISIHNDLIGLQGGISGEYYHLSEAQYVDYIGRTEVENITANITQEISVLQNVVYNISGSSLPEGTSEGSILYWDSSEQVWKETTDIIWDGNSLNSPGLTLQPISANPDIGQNTLWSETSTNKLKYGDSKTVFTNSIIVQDGTFTEPISSEDGDIVLVINSNDYIDRTEVESISASLQSQIDSISAALNNISTITISSSGGTVLISQDGNNYNLEVDTSGITASGISVHNELTGLQGGISGEYYHLSEAQYVDYIGRTEVENITGNFNNYTLLTTTQEISSNLQTQINNIDVITVSSSGGTVLISQTGNNYNLEISTSSITATGIHNDLIGLQGGMSGEYYHLSEAQYVDYIGRTEVETVSASLQTQISSITGFSSVDGMQWIVITEDTSAVKSYGYVIDASIGNITLTLPPSPEDGDEIGISTIDISNYILLSRNGKKIFGLEEDIELDRVGIGFSIVYSGDTYGWTITTETSTISASNTQLSLDINENSTDDELPTAKSVYDFVKSEIPISMILRTTSPSLVMPGKCSLYIPSVDDWIIHDWTLVTDITGNVQVDILVKSEDIPTNNSYSICGGNTISITSGHYNYSEYLPGWTTTVTKGDVFELDIIQNTNAKIINLVLHGYKT